MNYNHYNFLRNCMADADRKLADHRALSSLFIKYNEWHAFHVVWQDAEREYNIREGNKRELAKAGL